MPKLLFVDDEENVLSSMKVMLYRQRSAWDIAFASSGGEALDHFHGPDVPDVLITDIHMPGINGEELLRQVVASHPDTIRIILSGNLGSESLPIVSRFAHQVVAKPCDPDRLRDILARAIYLKERLRGTRMEDTLLSLGTLPSVPILYWEIVAEINAPEPSLQRIGQSIAKDPGLTAKVLQLVNVHAGRNARMSDVMQATSALGLETMKNCVLMAEIFSNVDSGRLPEDFDVNMLWMHGLKVGEYAKLIAESETENERIINDAYTGGLLHDLGLLVLASNLPEKFGKVLEIARNQNMNLVQAERKVLGVTHAEIGGYLVDLWGLAPSVVRAIRHHFFPSGIDEDTYEYTGNDETISLASVHAANFFVEDEEADCEYGTAELDMTYLERCGLGARIEDWWELCTEVDHVS